jgi:SAM-dependent methyltransferase
MSAVTRVHHPIFARLYARLAAACENQGASEHRVEMLRGVAGSVIEIGSGTGLNFVHYPQIATEVVAIEPEARLRELSAAAASAAPLRVTVVDAVADALPFPDGRFDAGVVSLVLCSVPDQARALAELHRVIRKGGELRFYEHVLSATPKLARWQRRADLVWPLFAGGCHVTRETADAIERAGFVIEERRDFTFRPSSLTAPASPHILGRARRP